MRTPKKNTKTGSTNGFKLIEAKTTGQQEYLDSIKSNKITFCIGQAGTGKTYLATRYAAGEFITGAYDRIIITRPMVQAGENTGFLPGDILAKMDPFVRPVYDELRPFFDTVKLKEYLEDGTIEVVPYAYMRGRTFHRALILADESQNATFEQLKLLLTRFGQHSKMIVNGDVTQSDLAQHLRGALFTYANALKGVDGINTVFLENKDIQREKLVDEILKRIDKA